MHDPTPTLPSNPDRLAKLAFGSLPSGAPHVTAVGRHLALMPLDALELDLSDPEQRRFGDYELLEKIGQGGMGVVYRARQHSLDRDVALKLLAAGPWASDDFVARFRREAQSAARMQHPNIVEIYEIGQYDALNFFAMRLVRGHTLAQELRRTPAFDPLRAARLMRTIAEAVDYAHRLNVLHLDLKPGNVLLDERGEPLVADFGLARRLDEGYSADGDEVSGTPSYMAPEQAQLKSHKLSPATDIYGLGAILYELLTGVPPFLAATPQDTLQRVVEDPIAAPRSHRTSIPADLEAICLKCLARDPAERYISARALADDLGRFIDGRAVSVRRPSPAERLQRWTRREPKVAVAATTAFLALAFGLTIATLQWRDAERARIQAEQQRALAAAQSERSQQLVSLIAAVFPKPVDDKSALAIGAASDQVAAWLKTHLDGRDRDQGDILAALVEALDRADNPGAAGSLLMPVVEKLGVEFRRRAAEVQIARGTPRSIALGVALLQSEISDPTIKARQQTLLADALRAAPDDLDVLRIGVYYCDSEPCLALEPRRKLAEAQPDNGANWIFLIASGDTPEQQAELLRQAASASHFDDHYNRIFQLNDEAGRSAGIALPDALRLPAEKLSGESSAQELLSSLTTYWAPIPTYAPLMDACNPQKREVSGAMRTDCLTTGNLAAYRGGSLIANMIGAVIIRRLLPGTEEYRRARELRRHYVYTSAMRNQRTAAQIRASRDDLMGREIGLYGEMEAAKRTLDRAGIPRDPPAGWEPDNPEALMTSDERATYRDEQKKLSSRLQDGHN